MYPKNSNLVTDPLIEYTVQYSTVQTLPLLCTGGRPNHMLSILILLFIWVYFQYDILLIHSSNSTPYNYWSIIQILVWGLTNHIGNRMRCFQISLYAFYFKYLCAYYSISMPIHSGHSIGHSGKIHVFRFGSKWNVWNFRPWYIIPQNKIIQFWIF